VAVLLVSSLLNAIIFFRVIENAYFEPPTGANMGHGAVVISRDEAPPSMLFPMLVMTAGILSLGILSGKIVSKIVQFAVPVGM